MDFILFVLFFFISYIINLFYLFNGFIPLLWLPYVIYKICKKEYKLSAILMCIVGPVVWNLGLIILGFVLGKFGLYKYIEFFFNSSGAAFGGLFAIIIAVLNVFSKQAVTEFKSKLEAFDKC